MRVQEDPTRGGRSFGFVPAEIRAIISSPIIQACEKPRFVRLSLRPLDNKASYFFEDNEKMLRLVMHPTGAGIQIRCFKLIRPNKRSPARPAWVELTKLHRVFEASDIEKIAQYFIDFFLMPSFYPLSPELKIKLNEDLAYLNEGTHKQEPDPVYFCGYIKEVVEITEEGWTLILRCVVDGQDDELKYLLKKGSYYGKPPAVKNWVIAKHGHLTAVVSDRDLGRYFVHYTAKD